LKRQQEVHTNIYVNGNVNLNNVYLRRRRLNIQDEEQRNFNSDEEEEKVVSEINRELELLSPEDAAD
jgi:hypothetical protein